MDPLHITLLILLSLALVGLFLTLRDRARLVVERDLARARLTDAEEMRTGFQAVAGEVLRNSSSEFLKLAKESLAAKEAGTLAELDGKRREFDKVLEPLKKAVQETQHQLRRSEKDQAGLSEQILRMTKSNRALRQETGRLVQALSKPNVRGRYGEIQLERVVELAGMRSYCDFTLQEALRTDENRLQKPDMVVRLPNRRVIAIDSKVPLDAFLAAAEAPDEAQREELLDRYARNVVERVKDLASKEYWDNFEDSPELVVMFLPGDQLVDAALERRPDLIELAARANVVIASPSTLIGLLRAVHVGWRERNLSESAEELFRLGRELHKRAAIVIGHAERLGVSLEGARRNYNTFVGSVENRLVPTLRKFEERDARSTKDVRKPRILEEETRRIDAAGLFDFGEDDPEPLEDRPAPRKIAEPS